MNFGRAIKIGRSARGLSQKKLGYLAGLDPSFISLIEMNKRKPSFETFESIAKNLDIPLHLLILLASEKKELNKINEKDAFGIGKKLLNVLLSNRLN